MKNQSKRAAMLGVMTALALILSYVESMILFFPGIPGIKLGFANLIMVLLLYHVSWKDALLVSVVRILVSGFLFGNLMSILFSLAGGVFSLLVMSLLKKVNGFSLIGVSIAGGCMHNIGQFMAALLIVQTGGLIYYLPALLISGLITGFLIGIAASVIGKYLPRELWKEYEKRRDYK